MRKETTISQFDILSLYLPGRAEEVHDKPQYSQFVGRDLRAGPLHYEAGLLVVDRGDHYQVCV
jgi:hypothetical protein